MNVPYVNLPAQHSPIKEEMLEAISRVMDHGIFIMGQELDEFETQFAAVCGSEYAVGVNSGTDALILALKVLGVGPGDEVITPPNSFLASTSCITMLGAQPVFVDVRDDFNIDPELVEQAITPRTKAILPVHLTGRPADLDPIMAIAARHNLHVVEDCAQAIGAKYKKKTVGSFGDVGCFSLHPLKTLNACGDGGVLTTNDRSIYEQVKILRNHGLRSRDDCVIWSMNSRLDTIQAAILLVKLKYLNQWTEQRRHHAGVYQKLLADIQGVQIPIDQPHEHAVYHTFVIQAERRDQLQMFLSEKGIGSAIAYPTPIHLQEAAAHLNYPAGSFPVTELQASQILNLPVYGELQDDQLMYVANTVRMFYGAD